MPSGGAPDASGAGDSRPGWYTEAGGVTPAPPRRGAVLLTIVIPTKDRPELLARAVSSALAQRGDVEVEVVVVDDGSDPPVALPPDDRLRVERVSPSGGGAAARNRGTSLARGELIAYLDDDDELTRDFARLSVDALRRSQLPPPVAVTSTLVAVDPDGRTLEHKRPQPVPRGGFYALEEPVGDRSFHAKQTLVVPTAVLRDLGGWDETFRSRVHTELFLRLNPVCSVDAIDAPTYRLLVHPGPRVSKDPALRQRSAQQLLRTHAEKFAARPRGTARFLLDHAEQSWRDGERLAAVRAVAGAARRAPELTVRELVGRHLHRRRSAR